MPMRSYTGAGVARARQLSYWNSVMREVFLSPWELDPVRPDSFDMSMAAIAIDHLRLSKATLSQSKVLNLAGASNRSSDGRFYLQLTTAHQTVRWDGGESVLMPGDFTLFHSSMECLTVTNGPYTSISLSVPDEFMREFVPNPEAAIGRRFSGSSSLSSTASSLLGSMWELAEAGVLPEVGMKLARNLLEVFATCWFVAEGRASEPTPAQKFRSAKIRAYVDRNLRDPELSVEAVAAAFDMSPRYLQMMFAAEGDTLSAYIRRQRLEACGTELSDPLWRDRSITEIAFRWGFNNTTHFARAFRDHYGVCARDYRKRRISGAS